MFTSKPWSILRSNHHIGKYVSLTAYIYVCVIDLIIAKVQIETKQVLCNNDINAIILLNKYKLSLPTRRNRKSNS